MSLEMRLEHVDLVDAIAYEFFMENLQTVLGDSLEDPELRDERILEVVESITLLAGMAYGIAGKFKQVRTEFRTRQDEQAESD